MPAGTVRNTAYPDTFISAPGSGFPYSIAELKKAQLKGPLFNFLRRLAVRDVVQSFDDFNRKAIDSTNLWSVANGGGAAAASFATQTAMNGVIRATTGTANDATASASLIGPVIYPGYANPGFEIRFALITSIVAAKVEVGFIDAVPASNTSGFNNMDTPTAFFTNGAVVAIDTGATANKFNLLTKGNATNQAIKKTNGTTGLATAGTYQTIRVQMLSQELNVADSALAAAWINGQFIGVHDVSATAGVGAVKGSTLLAPWAYIAANSATSKSMDIDYIWTWADRI